MCSGGLPMKDQIAQRLTDLTSLDRAALRDLWKQLFDVSPSPKLRRDLMIPILAYRIQEEALGSLSSNARRKLSSISRAVEANSKEHLALPPSLKPGTRLVRQWRDQVHLVNVEAEGYEYRGIRYQSLSEIARFITGSRRSGPLFFGTKNHSSRQSQEAA